MYISEACVVSNAACMFILCSCVCTVYYKAPCLALGCYGDVLRVKILYNKKDSALIQFAEAFQAHSGMFVCLIGTMS